MKRALAEWGAIFSFGLALASVSYWGVSSFTDIANFHVSPGGYLDAFASDGALLLCDSAGNLEVIDLLDHSKVMEPMPRSRRSASFPGFQLRVYGFEDRSIWSVRVSLGWLALIFSALAAFCLHRYRQFRQRDVSIVRVPGRTWPEAD
jgi:hypothetical protein